MVESIALSLCVALTLLGLVSGRSSGAPAGACENLTPSPQFHGTPQSSQVPYEVDLSSFMQDGNGRYLYQPGRTYQSETAYMIGL